ncbi:hypothetical protein [Hoeflea sp.]|uniref:hypothetical protein n=1 Tax=Hoeflea sp. TaxID=1940281 RepID=UPI003B523033
MVSSLEKSGSAAEGYNRNSHLRYSAHCPGIVELTFKDRKHFIALTGAIVNLSVTGCLFANDEMPWANLEGAGPSDSLFEVISSKCGIYIPWTNTHCTGDIKRVGSFIIGIQFHAPLRETLVKHVAGLEKQGTRRISPRSARKYNRILPIAIKRHLRQMNSTGEGGQARQA